jgi:hypothetical protein
MHLHRDADVAQARYQSVRTVVHILRPPARHGGELLHQSPRQIQADFVEETAFGLGDRHW